MFLTASYVLRPVAGVGLLVVQKSADTELLRGRPIPAGPVAGAGRLVTKYTVQPVAVLRALGGIFSFSFIAVDVVRIVAGSEQPKGSSSVIHQAVRTGLDKSLVTETFIVEIALTLMSHILGSRSTTIGTTRAHTSLLGSSEIIFEIVRVGISLGDNWGSAGRLGGRQRSGLEESVSL